MSDASGVVSIFGGEIAAGKPVPEVVRLLEEALDRARSGEIDAIVFVERYSDGGVSHAANVSSGLGYYGLLGGLAEAQYQILKWANNDE